METRIEHGLSNYDYHAGSELSKSGLDRLQKSIKHFKTAFNSQTQAMLEGSALHKLVLEPESFFLEYAIAPDVDKRTKAGKTEWAEFAAENEGKELLTSKQMEQIGSMNDAVFGHPLARTLLTGGEAEVSYFWEREGIPCKCRPDYLIDGDEGEILIDLKSTLDASPKGFIKSIANFRYDVQASWYMDGVEAVTGVLPEEFIFVAVEKTAPYAVACYTLDVMSLSYGEAKATRDFNKFKGWVEGEADQWEGYNPELVELQLPPWAV